MRGTIFTTIVAVFLSSLCFVSSAFAQDDASVVVLRFERFNVNDDAMKAFYSALESTINEHPDLQVKEGGEVTIQDLILTAGCEEPNPECLSGLRDIIDADQIVFGSVQQSDDVYLITIKNFDFAEGRFVREAVDQTVEGSLEEVERALPAIVENFLYGPVGSIEVLVDGAQSPEVLFNGEKMGLAPTTLENLPLGEHVVTLRTDDGEEQTETVVLRHNEPETLQFTFESGLTDTDPVASSDGAPSAVPGWIVVGVGVAAVGFGIFETLQVASVDDDFDALCAEEGNVCNGSNAALGSPEAAARATQLEDDGSTAKTLQLVGFSVGGAALIVGSYLLYRSYSYEGAEVDTDAGLGFNDLDVRFGPTRDGAAASVGFTF